MIPKQLFFIWLGDNKPNYVDFAINAFKQVNPDFKIYTILYTIKQLENKENVSQYDHNVYNCIDYILNKNKYIKLINDYISYKRKFCQILIDILKLDILNEYGGIYLDCDTFPLKPFDDNLLNCKSFCCNTYPSYDKENRHPDCHFLGSISNSNYDTYWQYDKKIDTLKYHYYEDKEWLENRKLFFECKLNYKYNNDYYINHFIDRNWLNNKVQKCKYDKDFYL